MPVNIPPFFSTTIGRHVLLVLSLLLIIIVISLLTGRFARTQASTWLCQYDTDFEQKCAETLDAGLLRGAPENTASPTPTATAVGTGGDSQSAANVNSDTSATASAGAQNASASPSPSPAGSASPQPTPTKKPDLTTEEKERLKSQATQIRNLIRHHGNVMAFFYQAYYIALSELLFLGMLVAISLFFIAQKGWAGANEYIKTTFVVAAAGAAFFGLWPPVFEQVKNISDNKALFLEYKTLGNEVASYPITRSNVKNEPKEPHDFISYLDSEMARLGNVAVGFDYTKINYKGSFDINQNAASPSPTVTTKKTP